MHGAVGFSIILYSKSSCRRSRRCAMFRLRRDRLNLTRLSQSSLTPAELQLVFDRYSIPSDDTAPQKTMTSDAFTSFLLSPDNSAFTDQHSTVWHDMTRPLADYYISSSHNTYLVGHQLVGVSTIEGYIRALLHSCRSVERASPFYAQA